MRFVVTGTGRSGTGYTAHLFNAGTGLHCGHEGYFRSAPGRGESAAPRSGLGVLRAPVGRIREELRRSRESLDGDASWMAVPRLERFDGVVFLQLRHPLPVIRSFMGTRFFSEPSRSPAQNGYAAAHFDPVGDDVVDAMRWWVQWNERAAARADLIYPLEGLDAALFAEMLRMLDVREPRAVADAAVASVAKDRNSSRSRGDTPGQVAWGDLPDGSAKTALASAAKRFGYEPEDESVIPVPIAP